MPALGKIPLILRNVCCISFLFLSIQTFAQKTPVIKGIVVDSLEKFPLDSCLVTFQSGKQRISTYTSSKGTFSFQNSAFTDTVFVFFHKKNYQDFSGQLIVKNDITLDTTLLVPDAKMMEEVLVKSRIPAIVQRDDTTEYMVDSFGRKKGAMISEVLKNLPGIEITEDGRILHNGVPITEITVNGQTFYDENGQIALKNIPAEIVGKIQVMDYKSQEQLLNGLLSDGTSKSLNIKLKSGNHVFGNVEANAGTKHDFHGNGMINQLHDLKQVSLMGGAGMSKTFGFNEASPSLVNTNKDIGANYRDRVGKKFSYNASFTSNSNSSEQESKTQVQQFFSADSSFITNTYNYSKGNSGNYQGNVGGNWISSKFNSNFNVAFSGNNSDAVSNSTSSIQQNGLLKSESQRNNSSNGQNKNIAANLTLSKRFKKAGRSFYLTLRGSNSDNNSDALNFSNNSFYDSGIFSYQTILRQHVLSNAASKSVGIGATYSEPISKKLRLMLTDNLDINHAENNRMMYNIDTVTKADVYDSTYSSHWISNSQRNNTNVSLSYSTKKLVLNVGLGETILFSNRIMSSKDTVQQVQQNFSPTATVMYMISKTKNLHFSFSGSFVNPTIDQLRPVPDNSNPLFIQLGNPNLKAAFHQNYNLSYNTSNEKGRMMSSSILYAPTSNNIVNAIYYDQYLRRTAQYINVDGIYSINGHWNYSKFINKPTGSESWGTGVNAGYNHNIFFSKDRMFFVENYNLMHAVNYMKAKKDNGNFTVSLITNYKRTASPADTSGINTSTLSLGPRLDWGYIVKPFGEIRTSYQGNYNHADYSNVPGDRLNYMNHTINNTISWDITEHITVSSLFIYTYNGRVLTPSDRNTYFWTLSAEVNMLHDNGHLSFSAIDILNSTRSYSSYLSDNYITDIQVAKQKTYFSLSFQYNWLKKEKKKEKNPQEK